MKNTLKSSMSLIQQLEALKKEASMPLPASQNSAISDSWFVDNNPLLAACEANADFAWKYTNSNSDFDSDLVKLEEELDESLCATDLAFTSSVAFTPPTSPNTKIEQKQEIDSDLINTFESQMDELDECAVLIDEIFDPYDNDKCDSNEQRKIEEIQNWLLMSISSQGNEFLSQEPVENTKEETTEKEEADNVLFEIEDEQDSDVIIEPDVTQIVTIPKDETNQAPTRSRRKRQLDYNDEEYVLPEREPKRRVVEKRDKKRDQNKEAAKRYRERKKQESTLFTRECEDLEARNEKARQEIEDKIKERKVYIDLLISVAEKNNLTIHFPDWM